MEKKKSEKRNWSKFGMKCSRFALFEPLTRNMVAWMLRLVSRWLSLFFAISFFSSFFVDVTKDLTYFRYSKKWNEINAQTWTFDWGKIQLRVSPFVRVVLLSAHFSSVKKLPENFIFFRQSFCFHFILLSFHSSLSVQTMANYSKYNQNFLII